MHFKISILSALLIVLSFNAFCQDKIYVRDGGFINAIVKEVGIKSITYKRFDNPNGPDYTIAKENITKIVYQNGAEDNFNGMGATAAKTSAPDNTDENRDDISDRRPVKRKHEHYAPNVVALAPLQLSDNGIGVGASFERSLEKSGIIALYVPVYLTFSTNSANSYYGAGYTNNTNYDPMFYIAPTIKIYPTGNQGKVKYSVGPSLVLASGSQTNYNEVYNPAGGYYSTSITHDSRFKMGVMVINSLNINASPKIYLALELGLGGTYINKTGGVLQGADALTEFSFRVGYRFK